MTDSTLGEIQVKFGADLSNLTAGIATAKGQTSDYASSASKAMSDVASAQQKASEAARQLELAQANAALALKKAQDMAASGKSSDEQLAVAEAQAAVAAEKVGAAQINLTNTQEKAASAAKNLAESQQQEGTSASEAATKEQELASATKNASESSSGFGFSLGGMIGKVMDFGSKLGMTIFGIQSFIQTAEGIGQAFIGPNASMEQTTVAFETLLGKGKATQDFLKQLQQFAAATPFTFPELATDAQHMIAFGFASKDVIPYLTNIGDAMGSMGKSAADIDHIVEIFGQMHAAGKLNAGDMMQLADEGIPAWKMLADSMHMTVPEVQKLTSQGLIPADKAIKAVSDGMHNMFGGGMAAQANTFNGLLSTFQDNIGAAWRAFTGPLFDKAKIGLTDLGNLVSSPAFQSFAKTLGTDVGNALNSIGNTIGSIVTPALSTLGDWFGKAQKAWQDFSSHIDVKGIQKAFGDFSQSFQDNILKPLGSIGADLLKPIQDAFKNTDFGQLGQAFSKDLISNLKDAAGHLKDVGDFLKNDVKPALDAALPKILDLANYLKNNVIPQLKDASSEVLHFADTLQQHLAPQIDQMNKVMSDPHMQPIWHALWQGVTDELNSQWNNMQGIVKIGWSTITGIILVGYDLFFGDWKKAWGDLTNSLGGIWDGIRTMTKDQVNMFIDNLRVAIAPVKPTLTGPFLDAYNEILSILQNIQNAWNNAQPGGASGNFGGGTPSHGGGGAYGGYASGGLNIPKGRYKVGENGPEILDIPGGSNVYNNAMSRSMAASSANNTPALPIVIEVRPQIYLNGQEMTDIIMQYATSQILSHGPVQAVLR